jgi:hypothetical protein
MGRVWLIALPGLSLRLLRDNAGALPAFTRMAGEGWLRMLVPPEPADGAMGEATLLTGMLPEFHGFDGLGGVLRARPFWERAGDVALPVRCGLFEKALGFATPGCGPEDFPGHGRNGERILELLGGTGLGIPVGARAASVAAFRMHGLSAVALEEGPQSARLAKRLVSIDGFIGQVMELAAMHHAAVCITGMYAVSAAGETPSRRHADALDQPAVLFWNFAPVGETGIPKDTIGGAEVAWMLLDQLTGKRWRDVLEAQATAG